jgi:toxin YoeB
MKITFANTEVFNDYNEWTTQDKTKAKKIMELIKDIQRMPYEGIGHPEPLKYELSGYWSRQISHEHRLVYKVVEGTLEILSCKYHYEK